MKTCNPEASAIETSKNVHVVALTGLWADSLDRNRMATMLHGFCICTNMDLHESEAYAEMRFLAAFASGWTIDMEEYL